MPSRSAWVIPVRIARWAAKAMPAAPARESNLAAARGRGSLPHPARRSGAAAGARSPRYARQHHRLARGRAAGRRLCIALADALRERWSTRLYCVYLAVVLAPVSCGEVACEHPYIIVTEPFVSAYIEVPTRTLAANSSAALLAVDRSACRPGSNATSGVTQPARQVTY